MRNSLLGAAVDKPEITMLPGAAAMSVATALFREKQKVE